ncbi:hypothetical protein NM688_g3944 [Phlebia brevispora]|uniref:Uncharacterized protein n=1 Tax=Phlebia brevispora TaxID=194682 RepID=A0ACC1T4I4_9APHY|nr:hypothetical protein NM688_g3944 [Phlebia brevispora]
MGPHNEQSRILIELFGIALSRGIRDVFNHFCQRTITSEAHLHENLAPCYGNLTQDSLRQMDSRLKVMIAGTMRTLRSIPPSERNWDRMISAFLQNTTLEEVQRDAVDRSDCLTKGDINFFKWDPCQVDPSVVNEVQTWFSRLISDADVLNDTNIDVHVMSHIVAKIGVGINDLFQLIFKDEYMERDAIDIGVLRFPDPSHPYLKITLVSDSLFAHISEYHCRKFKPREEVISRLKQSTIDQAVGEAESLFGD